MTDPGQEHSNQSAQSRSVTPTSAERTGDDISAAGQAGVARPADNAEPGAGAQPGNEQPANKAGRPVPPPRPAWVVVARVASGLVAATFLALFFGWPILEMLVRGVTGPGGGLDFSSFAAVAGSSRTWKILWQTVWLALGGAGASVIVGVPLAYVLYRLRFVGNRLARGVAMVPFVLPTVVVGGAFRSLFDAQGFYGFLGLDQSTFAVVCAMAFFNAALVARTVGTMWEKLPAHHQAAATLGASPARAFFTVTLPELWPSIMAGAALAFLFCSTSYGLVVTLGTPGYGTLETEIYIQTITFLDLPAAAVLSVMQALVVLIAVVVSQVATRRTQVGLKLQLATPARLTRWSIPAIALTVGATVLLFAAPIVSLVVSSLTFRGEWTLSNYIDLTTPGTFTAGVTPVEALLNSLRLAAEAALVALGLAVLVVVAVARPARSRWGRALQRFLDGTSLAPLGISAVTLGFGIFITLRLLFNGSSLLIPVAQALVALPMVVRAIMPALRAVDPRQREAAATLGAGPWRSVLTVDLPIAARGLGVGLGFALAISLGEFGATSFLVTADSQTLPVLIAKLLGRPGGSNYGMAMAAAVILAVITSTVIVLADTLAAGSTKGAGGRAFGRSDLKALKQPGRPPKPAEMLEQAGDDKRAVASTNGGHPVEMRAQKNQAERAGSETATAGGTAEGEKR